MPGILGAVLCCACRPPPVPHDTAEPVGGEPHAAETGTGGETGTEGETGQDTALTGRIVFHRYSSYDSWDSVLLMLELSDHSLTEISTDWDIDHAMNAHFSPDGSQLVFMGDQRGGERDWDVFLWTIGSSAPPRNLTEGWGTRDEDPKFTPDGTIVCKSGYDLIELDTTGSVVATLTSDGTAIEQSMPFATHDGAQVIYARGAGKTSDLHLIGRDGADDTIVQCDEGVQEYYPIVRDAETYLFTRWVSATNAHDQVYLGNWDGTPALALPLNDASSNDSDAFPYGDDAVLVSSTRSGGAGGYDLYVADITSGTMVSLSAWNPGINTSREELGAAYTP